MKTRFSRALTPLAIALAILLAGVTAHPVQAAKTLPGASAGITQLADPSDVPWGG